MSIEERDRCPVCGATRFRFIGVPLPPILFEFPTGDVAPSEFFPQDRRLVECTSCSVRCYREIPEPGRITDYFKASSVEAEWAGEKRVQLLRSRLEQALGRDHFQESLRALDIGCHTGAFLRALPDNWSKIGVEENDFATAIAQSYSPGMDFIVGRIEDVDLPDQHFDLVTAWDVLEHLDDLRTAIAHLCDAIAPGGLLVFETGFHDSWFARVAGMAWYYYSIPDHLVFMSKASIERLIADHGLELIGTMIGPHAHRLELSDKEIAAARLKTAAIIVYTIRGRWHWPHHTLSRLLNRKGTLPHPYFADHITVVARKRVT